MSAYQFAPSNASLVGNEVYVNWSNGFTEEELDILESYCDTLSLAPGVTHGEVQGDYRKSKVGWISCTPQIQWFYDKMAYICRTLNNQYYDFDMWGFVEDFQYTVYDGEGQGYEWHVDTGDTGTPRKLSMVLQLSKPEDYEGGELQLLSSRDPINIKKERGFIVLFPSYTLHRVAPVASGVRKTIVIWATGPGFK